MCFFDCSSENSEYFVELSGNLEVESVLHVLLISETL